MGTPAYQTFEMMVDGLVTLAGGVPQCTESSTWRCPLLYLMRPDSCNFLAMSVTLLRCTPNICAKNSCVKGSVSDSSKSRVCMSQWQSLSSSSCLRITISARFVHLSYYDKTGRSEMRAS